MTSIVLLYELLTARRLFRKRYLEMQRSILIEQPYSTMPCIVDNIGWYKNENRYIRKWTQNRNHCRFKNV